jgi:hypothetical protein
MAGKEKENMKRKGKQRLVGEMEKQYAHVNMNMNMNMTCTCTCACRISQIRISHIL